MKTVLRNILLVMSTFLTSQVEGALLVAPTEEDFTDEERVTIYRVLKGYSLPNITELRKDPSEFIGYEGTERDFVEQKIRAALPATKFTIQDVPMMLHDVWFLQEYFRNEELREQVDSQVDSTCAVSEEEERESKKEKEEMEVRLYFQASREILAKWVRREEASLMRDWLRQILTYSDAFPGRQRSFRNLQYEYEKLERGERSFLQEALRMEIQAIEEDRVVFFRGSRGFNIWDMQLLDFPFMRQNFSYGGVFLEGEYPIRTHEFSFSSSLLGGFLRDSYNRGVGSCTYALIYNEEGQLDDERIIYALKLDKRWLVYQGMELFYLPKTILGGVWEEGELFHPRLRSILGCPAERIDPSLARQASHSVIAAHHYTPPLRYDFNGRKEEFCRSKKEERENTACKIYLTELLTEYVHAARELERVKGTWRYNSTKASFEGLEKFLDPNKNFPSLNTYVAGDTSVEDIIKTLEQESAIYLRGHRAEIFKSFVEGTEYIALDEMSPSQLKALSYGFEVAQLLAYNTEMMFIDAKGSQDAETIIRNQRTALERLWDVFMPTGSFDRSHAGFISGGYS